MKDASPTLASIDSAGSSADAPPVVIAEQPAWIGQPRSLSSFGRLPAVSVVLGLAAGVIFDRHESWSLSPLLAGFAVACLAWGVLQMLRRFREATLLVVAISAFVGAIYHHTVWHSLPADDIEPLLSSTPTLVRCEGVVASTPVVSPPRENPFNPQLPAESFTKFELDVESLNAAAGRRTVSGRLQIVVDGILTDLRPGDRIDVQGWSQANRPLMNPGGFNVAEYARSKSLRGLVRVRNSELVKVVASGRSVFEWTRRTLRDRAEGVLKSAIPDDVLPVADAMLLGDRSTLPREMRTVFVESGTVHLLAISGLHIGILMIFLLAIGRAARLSSQNSILLAVAVLFIYLQVADC